MPLVPRCYELHGSEVVFGALVIPGCDISGLFDLVEDSFNEVPQRRKPWLAVFRVTFEAGDSSIYLKQSDDAVVLINARPPISVGLETRFPRFRIRSATRPFKEEYQCRALSYSPTYYLLPKSTKTNSPLEQLTWS